MPLEFIAKLNITQTLNENPQGEVEVTILYGEPFEVVKTIVENIGGSIEDLWYGYAIVNIPATNVVSLAQNNAIQYIEFPNTQKLPNSQYNIINYNHDTIKREISEYLKKYVKAAKKKRHMIEPLFRVSSLINFHKELGIEES